VVGGTNTSTSHAPPFSLPLRYMLTGMVGYLLFAVDLVIQSRPLGMGVALAPTVIALTHLLTLGVLLSFVMGAVFQLSTVAFLTPIRSVRTAKLNYWLYLSGVIGLWISMDVWWTTGLLIFGTFVTIALYIYSVLVIVSVSKSTVKGAMRGFVISAHAYLILAVTDVWFLILSFSVPQMVALQMHLLATHILLAVGGFFTFLVIGFSYKLLPMFTLSHGFAEYRQKYTFGLLHGALWICIIGAWVNFFMNSTWLFVIGGLAALAGFCIEIVDIREIYKKRMRKKPEYPIRMLFVSFSLGGLGCLLMAILASMHASINEWQSLITFYLLGLIAFTIMNYAYKIVPFLIWTNRYGPKAGQTKIRLMADLLDLKKSTYAYVPFIIGLLVVVASVQFQLTTGAVIGCVFLAIAIVIFASQMLYVLDVRKIPADLRVKKNR
jgi:hypothetical protein